MAASPAFEVIELRKDRMYWLSAPTRPRDNEENHFFSIDSVLVYQPLVYDFGPVDIGMTHWYVHQLHDMLSCPELANKKIIHYCSDTEENRANAAYLICAYMVIIQQVPPEKAFEPFLEKNLSFLPFRDVSRGPSTFPMTILDCLHGLDAGIRLGWYERNSFDLGDYVHYQQIHNGDMNWIVPGKFLAFAGPVDESRVVDDEPACTALDLVPAFKAKGIEIVIRLNSKQYNAEDFTSNEIAHADLIFKDGSCPPDAIINKFLYIAEHAGAVAVHCKAGLGRTGTLIGLYAMKHHGITAMEYIAWSRLCRPGCIIGPQQQFLCDMQKEMFRHRAMLVSPHLEGPSGYPKERQSKMAERIEAACKYTDDGQGESLVHAKQEACRREATKSLTQQPAIY